MKYATGLNPSPAPPRLAFAAYLQPAVLPPIPSAFGHQNIYPARGWGTLRNAGNNPIGDCAVAGAMHAVMLWRKVAGKPVSFTDLDATDDYLALTGGKDTGVSITDMAAYWRNTGFRDRTANRHKILAYMAVDPTNLAHIDAACYLFDTVGLGVKIGQAEMIAFARNQPWTTPETPTRSYHFIPMVGKDDKYRYAVTWGGLQAVNEIWCEARIDEAVAVLSDENLISGRSLEGFDMDALEADLEALAA